MGKITKGKKGFTLVELLLSITLLVIILSAFFPFFTQSMMYSVSNEKKTVALNMAKELLYDFRHTDPKNWNPSEKNVNCQNNGVENAPNTTKEEFPINIYPKLSSDTNGDYYEVNQTRYYPEVLICQQPDDSSDPYDEFDLKLYRIHIQVSTYKNSNKVLLSDLYGYLDVPLSSH